MQKNALTVLLIEDDDVDAEAAVRSLRENQVGNLIVRAENGLQGLDFLLGRNGRVKIEEPYLIFLDLNMPLMNGCEFLRELRSTQSIRNSIVFVLTTSNAEEDKCMVYDKQIAGYILKSKLGEEFLKLASLLDLYSNLVEFPPSAS